MFDDLCFEVMVFVIDSGKLICSVFFHASQFHVGGAEVCPSLDNFESGFLCGGSVGSLSAQPTSRLPNTDRWVDCADVFLCQHFLSYIYENPDLPHIDNR